jgi:Zn finger protein HypA/HybF involved in hydrogenase expression
MSEKTIIDNLFWKIDEIVSRNNAVRVDVVKVKIGALASITPERFRELFAIAGEGTVAEGARLDIEFNEDVNDPEAQQVLLRDVAVQ